MRALTLPFIAVLLVAGLLGVQVAAGGGDFVPRRPPIRASRARFRPSRRSWSPSPNGSSCSASTAPRAGSASPARASSSRSRTRRSLDPDAPAALKAGLGAAVDRLERDGRLPKVSQLLPEALEQADLPGIVKTVIAAIPDETVDSALPTGPLLRRAIDELDVDELVRELEDPEQLESGIRAAILQAARDQILERLRP